MRGAFNVTMEVRYGPRSTAGPPGVTYAVGIPCRRVAQTRLFQGQFDFSLSSAWVTQDTVVLNPPSVSSPWLGAMFTDQMAADEVAFSDFPTFWFTVCRHEEMNPPRGADYYRDLIIPVTSIAVPPWLPPTPLPGPPVPGGLTYIAPGYSCASPTILCIYGDYLLSTNVDGTNGYYAFVYSPGTSTRIKYIGGVVVGLASDVFRCGVLDDGCAATFINQISPAGVACVSWSQPAGGVAGKMPFSVANIAVGPAAFKAIGVRIEPVVC